MNYFKNKSINVFDNKIEDSTGKVTTLKEDTSDKYSRYKKSDKSPVYVIKVKGKEIDLSKINDNATIIIKGDIIISYSESLNFNVIDGDIIEAENINSKKITGDIIFAESVTSEVIEGDVTSNKVTSENIKGDIIK